MMLAPRTRISPLVPGAGVEPSGARIRASQCNAALPVEPALENASSMRWWITIGAVSVKPYI